MHLDDPSDTLPSLVPKEPRDEATLYPAVSQAGLNMVVTWLFFYTDGSEWWSCRTIFGDCPSHRFEKLKGRKWYADYLLLYITRAVGTGCKIFDCLTTCTACTYVRGHVILCKAIYITLNAVIRLLTSLSVSLFLFLAHECQDSARSIFTTMYVCMYVSRSMCNATDACTTTLCACSTEFLDSLKPIKLHNHSYDNYMHT